MNQWLTKAFGFQSGTHSVKTEIFAGITSFLTMAYILAVNPQIFKPLSVQGMAVDAVYTATALAAIVGTLIMALYAKKPFALAPGMGLNAFFVFTICLGMGHTWQFALTAVLIEGFIFILLTIFNIRRLILDAIPMSLKKSIGTGIGLFIAFLGLQNAGVIVHSDATLVSLGNITQGSALLALIGIVLTAILVHLKVNGAILFGILGTALLGLLPIFPTAGADGQTALTSLTVFNGVVATPPSVAPIFCKFQWTEVFTLDMLVAVFTLLFFDMFDTMGTLIGVATKANMLNEKGEMDDISKAFMADSIATIAGAMLGTNTTTTYMESASGVAVGGRTGLTAFTTAVCFAIALFFAPIFLAIPTAATSAALVIVGLMMISPISEVDLGDFSESVPAFITCVTMPLACSISDGILIGMIAYVLINACTGQWKKVKPSMWILAILFILKYILL